MATQNKNEFSNFLKKNASTVTALVGIGYTDQDILEHLRESRKQYARDNGILGPLRGAWDVLSVIVDQKSFLSIESMNGQNGRNLMVSEHLKTIFQPNKFMAEQNFLVRAEDVLAEYKENQAQQTADVSEEHSNSAINTAKTSFSRPKL